MAVKPMLAKSSVVRAIMAGLQTQDRRPVKPQPWKDNAVDIAIECGSCPVLVESSMRNGVWEEKQRMTPKYAPGDIIWVRETFCGTPARVVYRAGLENTPADDIHTWTPSIHMPKWACRLFLKVNAVRVERIRDISWQDACAEGFTDFGDNQSQGHRHDPRGWFQELWESIYPGTWKRNHWVWVYEFEITDKPADWPGN